MEDKKYCALCKKEIQRFWVCGTIENKENIMCSECAVQILMQQNWNLQDENQALKDRWEKFKEWVDSDSVGVADDGYHWVIRLDEILEKIKELENRQ